MRFVHCLETKNSSFFTLLIIEKYVMLKSGLSRPLFNCYLLIFAIDELLQILLLTYLDYLNDEINLQA